MEDNFTFNVSISTQAYNGKNNSWNTTTYLKTNLTVSKFIDKITKGHCYCYIFNDFDEVFGQSVKTLNNFLYSNVISIDIDDSDIEMKQYVDTLSIKPTFAYTTPSNGVKGFRFRLVYIFRNKIKGIESYKSAYNSLINKLDITLTDNCACSPAQQMGGNDNAELYVSNVIFDNEILNNNNTESVIKNNINRKEKKNIINLNDTFEDKEFIQDLNSLSPSDFIEKYRNTYSYFDKSEVEFNAFGYAILDENYLEIYRKWHIITNAYNKKQSAICKIKDGEKRRKKLYIAALIMKKIKSDITLEHLTFNLICERYYYYDNSDNVLTNKVIVDIAKSVYNTKSEDIKINSKNKKKFVIDKWYCAVHGINANSYKQKIKKELKYQEIGSLYDCKLTDKENLKILEENGIKISLSTLKRFRKEYDLNKYNKNNDSILNNNDNDESVIKNNIRKEERNIINLNDTFEDWIEVKIDTNFIKNLKQAI